MHIKNRNTERLKSLKFEIDVLYKCQFPSKWGFSYSNIRKRYYSKKHYCISIGSFHNEKRYSTPQITKML